MNYTKVTKEYIEWYALLSLIYCYDENLTALQKGEEPDWQSKDLDIGLEVTEALKSEDGRIRSVINKYFGRGLDGSFVKDQIENGYLEYSHRIEVVGNIACFSCSGDMVPKIQQVIATVITKTEKLNDYYRQFGNNWLYVFAPDFFVTSDIPGVYEACQQQTSQYIIQFDKVFINAQDRIFVLNPEGLEDEISISNDCLSRLKKEALEKSK